MQAGLQVKDSEDLRGVVRLRRPGGNWGQAFPVVNSTQALDGLCVSIEKQCATTRILVSMAAPVAAGAASCSPLRVEFGCTKIQISLWDDERLRFLGQADEEPLLAEEVLCFTMDAPRFRYYAGPASENVVKQTTSLTAQGLRLDCYLRSLEDPVILASLQDTHETDIVGVLEVRDVCLQLSAFCMLPRHSSEEALLFARQVRHAHDLAAGLSSTNWWVHSLSFKLPTLVVSVEDELLFFAHRVRTLLTQPSPININQDLWQPVGQVTWNEYQDSIVQNLLVDGSRTASCRLYINDASISSICVLANLHVSPAIPGVPMAIDTYRCSCLSILAPPEGNVPLFCSR